MVINQGAQANLNGKVFESMMIPIFEVSHFEVYTEAELTKLSELPDRYIVKNASFITIYKERGRTEFVIINGTRKIRVEVKYQATQGSVDEKYPYMLLNGIYQNPENEIIFVVDGGGYKSGARKWLQEQIDKDWLSFKKNGKDIKLMYISEFVNWFNHEFAK